MSQYKVYISAELNELSKAENKRRSSMFKTVLDHLGFKYKQALGSYKGSLEQSFEVAGPKSIIEELLQHGLALGQESILVVAPNKKCYLVYCVNSKVEPIGVMKNLPPSEALKLDSWSLIDGRYYAVA